MQVNRFDRADICLDSRGCDAIELDYTFMSPLVPLRRFPCSTSRRDQHFRHGAVEVPYQLNQDDESLCSGVALFKIVAEAHALINQGLKSREISTTILSSTYQHHS